MVASATLTVALALVALSAIAGSRNPSAGSIVDPAAFQPIDVSARSGAQTVAVGPLDAAFDSAGQVGPDTVFWRPGEAAGDVTGRPVVRQPAAVGGSAQKPPRYKVSGYASFYSEGTTAMRLPRGTTVIICGGGGCIERVINDYGPSAAGGRIADLYKADFFDICGCPGHSGTTFVTVSVY